MKYFISGTGDSKSNIRLYEDQTLLWEAKEGEPTWIALDDNLFFTVGSDEEGCYVRSYLKGEGDFWNPVDSLRIPGKALCHLALDPKQSLLSGACWADGYFFVAGYRKDGTFLEILFQEYQSDGTPRQSRCHSVLYDSGKFYAVNIELDTIFCYEAAGSIRECGHVTLPLGSGPRHILLNQKAQLLYAVTEYSCRLYTIDIQDPSRMKILSNFSTLPSGSDICNTGCTLQADKGFRHLYTANRGQNSISHFFLDRYGMPVPASDLTRMGLNASVLRLGTPGPNAHHLQDSVSDLLYSGEIPKLSIPTDVFTAPEQFSAHGKTPRHFALLDQDRVLGIANQDSDNIVFLSRDPETGSLSKEPLFELSFHHPSFICEI